MKKLMPKITAMALVVCMGTTLLPINAIATSSSPSATLTDDVHYNDLDNAVHDKGDKQYFQSNVAELLVGHWGSSGENFSAALKFNIGSYSGKTITGATLRLYVHDKLGAPAIKVSSSDDVSWTEGEWSEESGGSSNMHFPSTEAKDNVKVLYSKTEMDNAVPTSGWFDIRFDTAGIDYIKSKLSSEENCVSFVIAGDTSESSDDNMFGIVCKDDTNAGSSHRAQLLLDYTPSTTPLGKVGNAKLSNQGIASWDSVGQASGYSVQLYKDNKIIGSPVTTASDKLSCDFLKDMRDGGIGTYTVKITATGDGTNYTDGTASDASAGVNITKLSTVSEGLSWSGNVANWSAVTDAVSYGVQLYKDGSAVSGAAVNLLEANRTSGVDFSSQISSNGGGVYTYKVTAKGDNKLLLDADPSAESDKNIKPIQLAKVCDPFLNSFGQVGWTEVNHASNYRVQLVKDGSPLGSAVTVSNYTDCPNFLAAMRSAGVGEYSLNVTALGDGTYYSDAVESQASSTQHVIQLQRVSSGLSWSGTVAHWNNVSNVVSYDVNLYKNGSTLITTKNILASAASSGADFSANLASAGGGSYSYTVTAKGDDYLILDATQSEASDTYIVKTPLTKVTGVTFSSLGVASWNSLNHASSYTVKLYKAGTYTGDSVTTSDTNYDALSLIRAGGIGTYAITVTAKGDVINYSDAPESDASTTQTVVKLGTATGLGWILDKANWSAVTDAVSYDVQLYKDGSVVSGAIKNVLEANRASGVDFSSYIANNGGGSYTFKVTAKGNDRLILDAEQSAASALNIKAIPLAQVTNVAFSSSGIASWDNVANETRYSVQLYKNGLAINSAASVGEDELSKDFLSDMRAGGAGVYTVRVTAIGDGTYYSDGLPSLSSSSQTVIELATVNSGTWSGNVAHFSPITDALTYNVQLFKDGGAVTGADKSINVSEITAGVDFSNAIASEGAGTYRFKVTAKGDGRLVLDGMESTVSSAHVVASTLAQVTGVTLSAAGVATWKDVPNEAGYSVQLYKDGVALGSAVSKSADTLTHDFLADMRSAGEGTYTVKVTAIGDDIYYSNGLQSAASAGQNVIKLNPVDGLSWLNHTAYFNTVSNAVSYAVQLYKNGIVQGSARIIPAADALFGADFSSEVATGGVGDYTFKVTAIGDMNFILSADASDASVVKVVSVVLPQVAGVTLTDSGVAGWAAVENANAYLLQLYKDGVPYGSPILKNNGSLSHDFLSYMRGGGAGAYSFGIMAKGDGVYYLDATASATSPSLTLTKLATVSSKINWSNTTAKWAPIENASGYFVQLYKNGNAVGTPVVVSAGNAESGVDFNEAILANGFGTYTYKVTANGNSTNLLTGEQSDFSNDYIKQTKESTVTFDQNNSSKNNQNVETPLLLDSRILDSVKNGVISLKVNVDYTITGNAVIIQKDYLKTLKTGTYTFTITYKNGDVQKVTFHIVNTAATSTEKTSSETPVIPSNGDSGQTPSTVPTTNQTAPAPNQENATIGADKGGQAATPSDKVQQGTGESINSQPEGNFEVKTETNGKTPTFLTPSNQEVYDAVLTDDDKAAIAAGEKVTVKVVVDAVEAPEDANVVTDNLGDQTFGMFLDISVLKTIGEAQSQIHELNHPIKLTFDIPKELRGKPKYAIIRVHNGVTTVLEDEDDNPDTITFSTDRFSTYALVYQANQEVDTAAPTTPPARNDTYILWIILGSIVFAGMFFLVFIKRRKKEEEEAK